jgi:hypothetical protein
LLTRAGADPAFKPTMKGYWTEWNPEIDRACKYFASVAGKQGESCLPK